MMTYLLHFSHGKLLSDHTVATAVNLSNNDYCETFWRVLTFDVSSRSLADS